MKLFKCQHCGQLLFFENRSCERCGHRLGYIPESATLSALEPEDDDWRALADKGGRWRFCANVELDACNWLLPADAQDKFCLACRHNRTVPDLAVAANLLRWRRLELAKHWLFYSLLALRLPLATRAEDPRHGLAFDFLADAPRSRAARVMTGHAEGVVTLNINEADDADREQLRQQMGETYRTLFGHFRHEVGHYYWDVLVRDGGRLAPFREMFGDEQQDYAQALQAYYAGGPPANWQERFVSAYAAAHPWEDFAETWAHYLHIVDTLETASSFGMRLRPGLDSTGAATADLTLDPYRAPTIEALIDAWLPLTVAVNSLNRSMGQPDLYPFVLSPTAVAKLGFVHGLVHDAERSDL